MMPDECASSRSIARWVLPVFVGPSTAFTREGKPDMERGLGLIAANASAGTRLSRRGPWARTRRCSIVTWTAWKSRVRPASPFTRCALPGSTPYSLPVRRMRPSSAPAGSTRRPAHCGCCRGVRESRAPCSGWGRTPTRTCSASCQPRCPPGCGGSSRVISRPRTGHSASASAPTSSPRSGRRSRSLGWPPRAGRRPIRRGRSGWSAT